MHFVSREFSRTSLALLTLALGATAACSSSGGRGAMGAPMQASGAVQSAARATGTMSLREHFAAKFRVGAAINEAQMMGRDSAGNAIVAQQFNTISPENVLKWEIVHPAAERFDFRLSDAYVSYGEAHQMFIVGHTLVWHSQTPRWVFEDATGAPLTRDALLARMRDHIHTVVGRYKGRVNGWDVVNEALEEDGTLRKSRWLTIIGDDFIEQAFRFAQEADPTAELYYNDYSLENPAKRAGAKTLIKRLKAKGIPIKAIGMQAHFKLDWPSVGLEDSTITMFASLGVNVNITELDIDMLPPAMQGRGADVSARGTNSAAVNPYAAGLPAAQQQTLAQRYAEMFRVFLKHENVIDRVTFWGVADGDSWLNNWPVRGRTAYPLLFDRNHARKPAFDAVINASTRIVP
jgi:endo-1,4-beta-xylanase